MSLHDGHRQRLKAHFKEEGLDHFENHQVLELMLFYCVPRQDTNPVAHRLIERFGSVKAVLAASAAELKRVEGVGDNIVQFLRLFPEVERYCGMEKSKEIILDKREKCGKFMVPFFNNKRNETVYLLCLDAKCKVISCKMVGEGSVNSAGVPVRRIVEMALDEGATSVVLAHNHPSGIAVPSDEDRVTTMRLARALSAVEITLVDHVVVADNDYVSMADSGWYNPEENDVYAF
ncbi:MAG: RadC family protein [Oscillospiraceae bacterium]|nr:RadC family protein [Oscillospiraceae bacterium]